MKTYVRECKCSGLCVHVMCEGVYLCAHLKLSVIGVHICINEYIYVWVCECKDRRWRCVMSRS